MNNLFGKPVFARLNAGRNVTGSAKSRRVTLLLTLPLVAGMLFVTSSAKADNESFWISGNGFTAAGNLQISNTGPFGAYTVTGISGTFTDSAHGISGAITALNPAPPPFVDFTDTFFAAPAFTDSGFSYDNLFWPGGNSPAVCVDASIFSGGDFDVYGLSFDVAGGYTVDLWSNGPNLGGYQLNDSFGGVPFTPSNMDGIADPVSFTASPTPEPGSLLLLGSGMTGMLALWRRKRAA
jgi:hypothetical protein